jgi:CheY-like chemotaxis protein
MVIDDNAEATELMHMLLQMEGFMVESTVTGIDALARALAFMPQVICIDIELHDLPSGELVRQIRQHPLLADVRLIGMTGWDEANTPNRAVRQSFDSVYLKPVSIDEFSTEIRRHCYR